MCAVIVYTNKCVQFQKASPGVLFSCSVTDVFAQLTEWLHVIHRLRSPPTIATYIGTYTEVLARYTHGHMA